METNEQEMPYWVADTNDNLEYVEASIGCAINICEDENVFMSPVL